MGFAAASGCSRRARPHALLFVRGSARCCNRFTNKRVQVINTSPLFARQVRRSKPQADVLAVVCNHGRNARRLPCLVSHTLPDPVLHALCDGSLVKQVEVSYKNIKEVRTAPRAFGLWGDCVIFLKVSLAAATSACGCHGCGIGVRRLTIGSVKRLASAVLYSRDCARTASPT